ncbi:MAG: hypothetical protein V4805_02905 [Pseudomonadota bacterium]
MRLIMWNRSSLQCSCLFSLLVGLTGCASLLPEGKQSTQTPWKSYSEAQEMFAKIVPGSTTLSQLKALGVDPEVTSNVGVLAQADLLRRLIPSATFDIHQIDPGLQLCLAAAQTCFAYEIEQTSLDRKRYGNFMADFFNFRRRVDVTGWQFDAIVVIKGETVIFKQWSGKPKIHQTEDERSPLGPLQGIGPGLLVR